jgi:hypothetical protein
MMLLGDVGEREELCERARDWHGRLDWKAAQKAGQILERGRVAGVCALGERADFLHSLEERLAFAGPQLLAEQLTKQPDVVA